MSQNESTYNERNVTADTFSRMGTMDDADPLVEKNNAPSKDTKDKFNFYLH